MSEKIIFEDDEVTGVRIGHLRLTKKTIEGSSEIFEITKHYMELSTGKGMGFIKLF